jgi:UDP-N-acetylglucosamine 2-epimerase (hydrolysing)
MEEVPQSIFVIGSPDVDLMLSNTLPDLNQVKNYFEIAFENYGVAMFHPVTTKVDKMEEYAVNFVDALLESEKEFVVIFPNNDLGSSFILREYKRLERIKRF